MISAVGSTSTEKVTVSSKQKMFTKFSIQVTSSLILCIINGVNCPTNLILPTVKSTYQAVLIQKNVNSYNSEKLKYSIIQKTMIIIWELSQTCVFTWTFIEGFHIHELIVVSVFQTSVNMYPLMFAAWIVPIFITGLWLIAWLCINTTDVNWSFYTFHSTYWIPNSFRLVLLSMNMAFLINVILVLVRRFQTNEAPEIQKLRKAVKATVLLMPLLGITNFIVLLPEPNNVFGFFIICGLRKVLPTWQGFTISMIYYFMNKDVQRCIQMSIRKFKQKHQIKYPN
ncbi:unnamed protein product [Heterobilharzia americana]|nr:unnamed protein product [Heterobilharzia americana]CAH8450502.1 unnamed protein product [Heterobilharzia americana]